MNKFLNAAVFASLCFSTAPALAAQNLKYPSDCKNRTLETAAQKNGCYMKEGKGHKLVYSKSNVKITEIPNSVKDNNTCCSIIKVLNSQC